MIEDRGERFELEEDDLGLKRWRDLVGIDDRHPSRHHRERQGYEWPDLPVGRKHTA
jgi:hypothetical protein